jgi:hypothetical protein
MVLGVSLPHPDQIVSLASDGLEAVDTEQQSGAGALMSEKEPSKGNSATTRRATSWRDRVDLGDLSEDERAAVLRMLEPQNVMWDWHLGMVTAT